MQNINVQIKDLAAALKVNEDVVAVAEKVINQGLKPQARGESRQTRRHWETFCKFSQACSLPYPEALQALKGELDETYVSPAEVSQSRLDALRKANDKLRKELEKSQAYVQTVVETLINDIGRIPPTPFKQTYDTVSGDHEEWAQLDTGDWHTASCWGEDETGFGDMSTSVIEKRIELLTTKTLELVNLQRRITPIRNLCINWEGDFGENANLHPGSAIHVDNNNMDTLKTNVNMAERMIMTFLGSGGFEEVHSYMVRGNHGRMGKKGEQHSYENWDDLMYYWLAERFRDEPRAKFRISKMPFMAYVLPGQPKWVHCLAHGNDIPSSLSIPFYGISRAEQKTVSMLNRAINFSHFGHWHNDAQMGKTWGAVILNGSVTGSSPYGVGLRLASMPKQIFMGMHPELGQTWVYHIYLDRRDPPKEDENGVITTYCEGFAESEDVE